MPFACHLQTSSPQECIALQALGLMSIVLTAGLMHLRTLVLDGSYVALGSDEHGVLRRLLNQVTSIRFVGRGCFWSDWAGQITSCTLQNASFATHDQHSYSLAPLSCPNLRKVCLQLECTFRSVFRFFSLLAFVTLYITSTVDRPTKGVVPSRQYVARG
jgi:hypothetical protein